MATGYLLNISIGPVQDFIAASRKTRDLWYGSHLLSEVSHAAAAALAPAATGSPGHDAYLIFPDPGALTEGLPIANKIVAVLTAGDPVAVLELAEQQARTTVSAAFASVQRQLKGRLVNMVGAGHAGDYVDWDLADRQLADFLEWYAAWVELPLDEAGKPSYAAYRHALSRADQLLASRKATRDFGVAHGWRAAAKSSLNPSLETVFKNAGKPVSWSNQLGATKNDPRRDASAGLGAQIRGALRVKGAEQLDAISLLKRHAMQQRFPSLSRVAVDPLIRCLNESSAGKAGLAELRDLAKKLAQTPAAEYFDTEGTDLDRYQAFPYDCQLFYENEWQDKDLQEHCAEAKAFYEKTVALRKEKGIPAPPTYVAVVQADGDNMGKVLSKLPDSEAHQRLSHALARFAAEAKQLTQDHDGAFVYSGGDDVLAFLPLDRVLAYVDALRRAFVATVEDYAGGEPVSLSVGVVIGHYSENLQQLLSWAREAEGEAKRADNGERNALAVTLHTRGGEDTPRTVIYHWDEPRDSARAGQGPVIAYWNRWVAWHRDGEIPDGAAYQLQTLDRELTPLWRADPDSIAAWRPLEVDRILSRKRRDGGAAPVDPVTLEALRDMIGKGEHGLRRLIDGLIMARRLAAAAALATAPAADPEPQPATPEPAASLREAER